MEKPLFYYYFECVLVDDPFYQKGLHFECTRCSKCCRIDPGFVFLTCEDLEKLTAATSLNREKFIEKYCRVVNISGFKRLSLQEKSNYDCIMWDKDGCRVYEARPFQCRSYPFWSANLCDISTWNKLEKSCPGVNRGRWYSKQDIEALLKERRDSRFLTMP